MTPSELTTIASTLLHHCHPNCNLLVFGFSHESLLWHSLNSPSPRRTVFLDENQHLVASYERNFTDIEAYEVDYTTKVTQSDELIQYARAHRASHCKPVQNLLFSDCKLAVNDLPNHLYSIQWDVIIVDGPRGYSGKMPGRMSAIFTAAVLAMTPTPAATVETETQRRTHVFVHDYGREVEKMYSEEFLCKENLVEVKDELAHFVVKERGLEDDLGFRFCTGEEDLSSSS
ncbi:protein IRX15-LIKE-like [Silene latifolia]|uniref:protein IRX15-LIKE-like n=1 Tax=Silene latifolia TaxID=37657 RepID=UPI003D76BD7E